MPTILTDPRRSLAYTGTMTTDSDSAPVPETAALKEMFDDARFRQIAAEVATVYPGFSTERFLAVSLPGLADLTLMQRLRRMTESLHSTLPSDYSDALAVLRALAPRIGHRFVTLVLPDYVGQYGLRHFDLSMDALRFFTTFGSAEFAVRHFLRQDLARTLAVMETWSRDPDEHVRRLASEGCRPRLPWSFHLEALIADPSPVLPILENLKSDESLYVRKSVANHLNDITKDHPVWVLDRITVWPADNPHTVWIVKRALRTLIKKGDTRALSVIGAGEKAEVTVRSFTVTPHVVVLGDRITLSLELQSIAPVPQRLVIDYRLHYIKKSGETSAKVFKWKEVTLGSTAALSLTRTQSIRDFTTRVHYSGHHTVDLVVNGDTLATGGFDLVVSVTAL